MAEAASASSKRRRLITNGHRGKAIKHAKRRDVIRGAYQYPSSAGDAWTFARKYASAYGDEEGWEGGARAGGILPFFLAC